MTDSTLNRFLSSGTTTERLAFVPDPPVPVSGPSPSYLWWDTTLQAEYAYNFGTSAWVAVGGGGSGTVTTTGSPISGDLAAFSGSTSITSGNLSGDVTTSGSLTTTLANTAVTPGSYTSTNLTVDAKGRIIAATNGSVGSASQKGIVQVDGTTITASSGVISAVGSGAVTLIATATPTGTGIVTFNSISGVYKHIRIVGAGRSSTAAAASTAVRLTLNNDTGANYTGQFSVAVGNTGNPLNALQSAQAFFQAAEVPENNTLANFAGSFVIDIPLYSGTVFLKTVLSHYNTLGTTSISDIFNNLMSGSWNSTSAITRIDLTLASGNWLAGSEISLYGFN